MSDFFSDEQNLAELVTHMPEEDRQRFNRFGHLRIEAVFVNRVFIVYKPTGLTERKAHRDPDVLTTIEVEDFSVDPRNGCLVTVRDKKFDSQMNIGHVPKKLFNYPIYMSVPARLTLRWDARNLGNGRIWRSLSFALLVKTKNSSEFYSAGNTYIETPKLFKQRYPNVTPSADFKF